MKLELKHITPYLPYGLNFQCVDIESQEYEELPFVGINISNGFEKLLISNQEIEIDELDVNEYEVYKPILRPLSYLTKEIEVNGEKFVPSERIDTHFLQINGFQSKIKYCKSEIGNIDLLEIKGISCGILSVDYWIIQQLFEWHFDVFGLIKQGLAIDINTLEK
jgi:hypothetical protein